MMKNRILSITRNVIPYVKELNAIAGGVLSCIVMQQLDFWFETHAEGFYKFLEPTNHKAYKPGDSWTEELGMTVDEFRSAFDKIGMRYKSRTDFEKAKLAGNIFQGKFYCSYVDRRANLTYYFRNDELLDAALDKLIHNEIEASAPKRGASVRPAKSFEAETPNSIGKESVTDCLLETISVDGNSHLQELGYPSTGMGNPIYRDGNSHLQESGIPIYANGKSRAPLLQRIHTETTTTTTGPVDELSTSVFASNTDTAPSQENQEELARLFRARTRSSSQSESELRAKSRSKVFLIWAIATIGLMAFLGYQARQLHKNDVFFPKGSELIVPIPEATHVFHCAINAPCPPQESQFQSEPLVYNGGHDVPQPQIPKNTRCISTAVGQDLMSIQCINDKEHLQGSTLIQRLSLGGTPSTGAYIYIPENTAISMSHY